MRMLSNESIMMRLTIVKYLYNVGYSQSLQPESTAFVCLLSFHDAVEIFLKLVAEKENIKSDKFNFLEYWEKIPSLTLKESLGNLNARRVNLKHKGILPAKQDLEISRVNVTDFFEQNTRTQFGLEFKSISLITLVKYLPVKKFLEESQHFLDKQKNPEAIEKVAFAFEELLCEYEGNKVGPFHKSPFYFGEKISFWSSTLNSLNQFDRDFATAIDKIRKSVEALQESAKITALGIDYKKYSMFKLLTPKVRKMDDEYCAEIWGDRKWTTNNVQFCIDFVIDCSLKLQEFDFDIQHLIDDEPLILEYVGGDFETGLKFREAASKGNDSDSLPKLT